MVKIPDMFESFMSREPAVNPHYGKVGQEGLLWAFANFKRGGLSEQEAKDLRRMDFAYFGAIAAPDTDPVRFRVVVDWLNWVFCFDDQLDDGPLGHQEREGRLYVNKFMSVLENPNTKESLEPMQWILRDIWNRIQEDPYCTKGAKSRWLKQMKVYLQACSDSIVFRPSPTLEETLSRYLDYRRPSIAAYVLNAFVEYASGLQIPDEVFENTSIQALERIACELVAIVNDCISYHREKDQNCPHNMVHLFRHHGMSEQEAYDKCQVMLREKYREWYLAMASLPTWGEEVDKQVHRYIQGVQDVDFANAYWSFRSGRYYGKHAGQVRATRVLPGAHLDWVPGITLLAEEKAGVQLDLEIAGKVKGHAIKRARRRERMASRGRRHGRLTC
ncbi:uncharacterized protein L3040_008438 [Drepanopeziza brunnea f. sp. 'multigermtubi']|uniref:Terpene synthase n=1 Tax=Marssonina brunnea f. sp. multigermtubi (strain MB_m1) TaxID=1072389 RepID=K1WXV4_MARBU|nr:pentalenene synthase [Drepanopeziza brunnea f. sp. 'multigermtubi' MB_m1]EKD17397.1 pentalenene synthase [Drepanopeziza brunnea f. sp. 'multigermtubi' MB_m1]KAJ5035181.1 hypothetical protein L3040_008438 [Drepanopeziza brunnea f. sp. 'multigermtubi']